MSQRPTMVRGKDKDYLGDGVYINHDNFHTILTTEDGISVSNIIYLEPEMAAKIIAYQERIREKYAPKEKADRG